MKLLDLSGNALQGTLPTAFASALPSLNVLLLGSNSLTGTLPAAWSSLTSLTVADLGDNHLKGSLPASWSAWSNLRGLRLTSNSLTGNLPAAYGSWAGIQELELGQRPYCLCCFLLIMTVQCCLSTPPMCVCFPVVYTAVCGNVCMQSQTCLLNTSEHLVSSCLALQRQAVTLNLAVWLSMQSPVELLLQLSACPQNKGMTI